MDRKIGKKGILFEICSCLGTIACIGEERLYIHSISQFLGISGKGVKEEGVINVSYLFNINIFLNILVIDSLPRSKRLLISWLYSPSAVILV